MDKQLVPQQVRCSGCGADKLQHDLVLAGDLGVSAAYCKECLPLVGGNLPLLTHHHAPLLDAQVRQSSKQFSFGVCS